MLSKMLSRPMDISWWKQLMKGPEDGGEFVVTGNKMLKGGDERPLGMVVLCLTLAA